MNTKKTDDVRPEEEPPFIELSEERRGTILGDLESGMKGISINEDEAWVPTAPKKINKNLKNN
jgi:hypothetical protein